MIGKLLYLYEGCEEKSGRRELTRVFYLGGLYPGSEENQRLFRHMQKYIETNYETRYLKKVYVSGDCGAWIKTGVFDIDKGVMVMDKYHLMKYIHRAAGQMLDDTNEVKGRLWKALYEGKKKKFLKTLKRVRKCVPNVKAVDTCTEYVMNNWTAQCCACRIKTCTAAVRSRSLPEDTCRSCSTDSGAASGYESENNYPEEPDV